MTYDQTWPDRASVPNAIHTTLLSFPIACFSLTLVSDIAYYGTLNLLWLHFSEWLLLAGLIGGGFAAISLLVDLVVRKVRPAGLAILGGIVVMLLAILNSLIHTADGWTAVVPYGLAVSALTVIVMLVTGWLGRKGAKYV